MENKTETTIVDRGYIGIMEKKMELLFRVLGVLGFRSLEA